MVQLSKTIVFGDITRNTDHIADTHICADRAFVHEYPFRGYRITVDILVLILHKESAERAGPLEIAHHHTFDRDAGCAGHRTCRTSALDIMNAHYGPGQYLDCTRTAHNAQPEYD